MMSPTVEPIGVEQQQEVLVLTEGYIAQAAQYYQRKFAVIPVHFNLRGRTAGMFRVKKGQAEIRYNPFIFAKYYQDNLAATVPHEVAHYIAYMLYQPKRILPHGPQWRAIMQLFQADASRTCDYDFSGVPGRRQRRYLYQCACHQHRLSSVRHNRVQTGRAQYICNKCGQRLQYCAVAAD